MSDLNFMFQIKIKMFQGVSKNILLFRLYKIVFVKNIHVLLTIIGINTFGVKTIILNVNVVGISCN